MIERNENDRRDCIIPDPNSRRSWIAQRSPIEELRRCTGWRNAAVAANRNEVQRRRECWASVLTNNVPVQHRQRDNNRGYRVEELTLIASA